MAGFDANDRMTPFHDARGRGAILFDAAVLPQAQAELFDPEQWGATARAVDSGGRGGAWYVEAPFGGAVLRRYRRGGFAARFSRDRYLWRGSDRVRSFAEFRLTRDLHARGLPVPLPVAAQYRRHGMTYSAALLLERLRDVSTLAERASVAGADAPWLETGRLIARFHHAGLDHADLNAHNILFDSNGRGWLIDFDKSRLRIPDTRWRERNLQRLHRSLQKERGTRTAEAVDRDFARLREGYEATWERGA